MPTPRNPRIIRGKGCGAPSAKERKPIVSVARRLCSIEEEKSVQAINNLVNGLDKLYAKRNTMGRPLLQRELNKYLKKLNRILLVHGKKPITLPELESFFSIGFK